MSVSRKTGRITILTGAGISAESGLPTFRCADGLWEGHRIEDVATPSAFRRDPELVHRFYNLRREKLLDGTVHPNAAHLALAKLEREWPGDVVLITQNVDDLHERAGSEALLHLHGELLKSRCEACGRVDECHVDLHGDSICQGCGRRGSLRPHIVWFGEMPFHMTEIGGLLARSDWFVAIGTSGQVYPAAGFVDLAAQARARTIEINLDASAVSSVFDEVRSGKASELVPQWVDEMLAEAMGNR